MGTPPNPNAIRRNVRPGITMLPAKGRVGDTPEWPLSDADPDRAVSEARLWRQLWATPQAHAWEQLGWTRVVARYCRVAILAEELDKDSLSEARQLEDRIGLTPKAMRMLMWQIATDEIAERRAEHTPEQSARGRIKAVG